jgi:hypothetical protein
MRHSDHGFRLALNGAAILIGFGVLGAFVSRYINRSSSEIEEVSFSSNSDNQEDEFGLDE